MGDAFITCRGGGGMKINGVKRTLRVGYNKTVHKGDFVTFSEDVSGGSMSEILQNGYYGICKLNDCAVVYAYSTSNQIKCLVQSVDNGAVKNNGILIVYTFTNAYSVSSLDIVSIAEDRAVIFASVDSYLKAILIGVNGVEITVISTVDLINESRSAVSAKAMTSNKVLLLYNNTRKQKSALVVSIVGNSISRGTEFVFAFEARGSYKHDLAKVNDNCGFAFTNHHSTTYDENYTGVFFNISSNNELTLNSKKISGLPSTYNYDVRIKEFNNYFAINIGFDKRIYICKISRTTPEVSVVATIEMKEPYFLGMEVNESGFGCFLTASDDLSSDSNIMITRILIESDNAIIISEKSIGSSQFKTQPRSVKLSDGTAIFHCVRSVYYSAGYNVISLCSLEKAENAKSIGITNSNGSDAGEITVTASI